MLRKIFIIFILFILSISCSFSMVPAHEAEIEYDKMIRDANEWKQYTPSEIMEIQKVRREANNERIRMEMENFVKSVMVSSDVKGIKKKTKLDATGTAGGGVAKVNIIISIIILIAGAFMLLYSYSSISRKKKT